MEVVRETGLTFSYSLSTVFVYYFILYLVYTIGVRRKSPAFLATVLHVSLSLSLPSIIAGRGGRRARYVTPAGSERTEGEVTAVYQVPGTWYLVCS